MLLVFTDRGKGKHFLKSDTVVNRVLNKPTCVWFVLGILHSFNIADITHPSNIQTYQLQIPVPTLKRVV